MERKYNIGIDIDQVCRKYGIENYTIRPDGKVDVDGYTVNLYNEGLTKLPLHFGNINGKFWCDHNELTTLEGAPEYVSREFECHYNKLTSLEGVPKYIGGDFICYKNNILDIKALENCIIKEEFDIEDNPIFSIIADIYDFEHFFLINPLQGNKLSRLLYDEVRDDLNLPKFDYDWLHKDIELID